jgi:hypothetical protein
MLEYKRTEETKSKDYFDAQNPYMFLQPNKS